MDPASVPFVDPNALNLVNLVSTKSPRVYNPEGKVKIIVVDVGLKFNQLRCFIARGASVKVRKVLILHFQPTDVAQVVPWDYDFNADTDYDGLFISNGPGDPAVCYISYSPDSSLTISFSRSCVFPRSIISRFSSRSPTTSPSSAYVSVRIKPACMALLTPHRKSTSRTCCRCKDVQASLWQSRAQSAMHARGHEALLHYISKPR